MKRHRKLFRSRRRKNQTTFSARRNLGMESLEHRRMLATWNGADFGSIQEAIDAARANEGADTVLIQPGFYNENLYIQDDYPLTLKGEGEKPDGVVIRGNEGNVINIADSDRVTIENVRITGGTEIENDNEEEVDGNGIIEVDGDGIYAEDLNALILKHVESFRNEGDGAQAINAKEVYAIQSRMFTNDDEGLDLENVDYASLNGGAYYNNDINGIEATEIGTLTLQTVQITRNDAERDTGDANEGHGLFGDDIDYVNIYGGWYSYNANDGIKLLDIGKAYLQNVAAQHNGTEDGDVVQAAVADVAEEGTEEDDADESSNTNDGLNIQDSDELLVVGGNYSYNVNDGIRTDDVDYVTIQGVFATRNGGDGLDVEDDVLSVKVQSGKFLYNEDDGLELDGGEVWIDHIFSRYNEGDGVEIDDVPVAATADVEVPQDNQRSSSAKIVRAITVDNGDEGIEIDDIDDIYIEESYVIGNGEGDDEGLDIYNAEKVYVKGGVYKDNADDGIDLNDVDEASIWEVYALENGDDGLDAEDVELLEVNGGTYAGNGTGDDHHGIELVNVDEAHVTNVYAIWNGDGGLDSYETDVIYITGGLYKDNLDDGIDLLYTAKAIVKDVKATANGDDGLDAERVKHLEVIGGIYDWNGAGEDNHGIELVDDGEVILREVKVAWNGEDGINADNVDVILLDWVTAVYNGRDGFRFTGDFFDNDFVAPEVVELNPEQPGNEQPGNEETEITAQVTFKGGMYAYNYEDGIHIEGAEDVLAWEVSGYQNGDNGIEVIDSGEVDLDGSKFFNNGGRDVVINEDLDV